MNHVLAGDDNAVVKQELNEPATVTPWGCPCRVKVAQRQNAAVLATQHPRVGVTSEQQGDQDCLIEVATPNGGVSLGLVNPHRLRAKRQTLTVVAEIHIKGQRGDRVSDKANRRIHHTDFHCRCLIHRHTSKTLLAESLIRKEH